MVAKPVRGGKIIDYMVEYATQLYFISIVVAFETTHRARSWMAVFCDWSLAFLLSKGDFCWSAGRAGNFLRTFPDLILSASL